MNLRTRSSASLNFGFLFFLSSRDAFFRGFFLGGFRSETIYFGPRGVPQMGALYAFVQFTLPETNIAPDIGHPKRKLVFQNL